MCAFVHGFEPYFYIESPLDFSVDDCDSLRQLLDVCPILAISMHQSSASATGQLQPQPAAALAHVLTR